MRSYIMNVQWLYDVNYTPSLWIEPFSFCRLSTNYHGIFPKIPCLLDIITGCDWSLKSHDSSSIFFKAIGQLLLVIPALSEPIHFNQVTVHVSCQESARGCVLACDAVQRTTSETSGSNFGHICIGRDTKWFYLPSVVVYQWISVEQLHEVCLFFCGEWWLIFGMYRMPFWLTSKQSWVLHVGCWVATQTVWKCFHSGFKSSGMLCHVDR